MKSGSGQDEPGQCCLFRQIEWTRPRCHVVDTDVSLTNGMKKQSFLLDLKKTNKKTLHLCDLK